MANPALLSDSSHIIALGVAARAAAADSLHDEAATYWRRFLAAYDRRVDNAEFSEHSAELADLRREAFSVESNDPEY